MTFIPVGCGRNDVNDQAMGVGGGCSPPVKKLCAGHRTLQLDFLSISHITAFTTFFVSQSITITTTTMAKPFDPEEAENLEDVRPHVHTKDR